MRGKFSGGFSMIELMVTLVILAILVVLGFPSYQQWIVNSNIRNAAESIQNGLRLARNEASQRATFVRFEMSAAGKADWTVCQLPSAASVSTLCSATNAIVIQKFASSGGASTATISGSAAISSLSTLTTPLAGAIAATSGITFNTLGRATDYGNTSIIRFDANSAQANSRWLVTTISAGGSIRMCDPQINLSSTAPQGCSP
jgi:type IV fimbrial biogenesis protein FimT